MKKIIKLITVAMVACITLTACGRTAGSGSVEEIEKFAEGEDTQKEDTEKEETSAGIISLGQYKGLTVNVDKHVITDAELIEYRNYFFTEAAGDYEWNKAVEEGDTVNIDFVGKIDGEAFDGGSAQGYELVIGSHTFIDGFEDAMIGMTPGEVRDLDLKFPDNYGATELAGKPCVFTVTCNKIIPAISDEAVATLQSPLYSNIKEFEEQTRSLLEDYYDNDYKTSVIAKVLDQVVTGSVFGELPQDKMNKQLAYIAETYASEASMYGVDLDTYFSSFGTTTEEVASVYVKRDLVFAAIAEAEKFEATDEDIREYIKDMMEAYGDERDIDEIITDENRSTYAEYVTLEKVYDFLLANTIVESTAK